MSNVYDDLERATQPAHSRCTWPFVVNELIRILLTDEVLQSAHDAVSRSVQNLDDAEGKFANRLSKSARLCREVFPKPDLVRY